MEVTKHVYMTQRPQRMTQRPQRDPYGYKRHQDFTNLHNIHQVNHHHKTSLTWKTCSLELLLLVVNAVMNEQTIVNQSVLYKFWEIHLVRYLSCKLKSNNLTNLGMNLLSYEYDKGVET